ncbi:hypothetical protein Tco_1041461 [Tanacetum coccineum]|uniref:Uncharacterized protein n=1 Tax=Tanacetum coccineum TaxID=301880 RepID=A0ABQ5GGW8_9ASTR
MPRGSTDPDDDNMWREGMENSCCVVIQEIGHELIQPALNESAIQSSLSPLMNAGTVSCRYRFMHWKFAKPVPELHNRFARRFWIKGLYIGTHLSLKRDVQLAQTVREMRESKAAHTIQVSKNIESKRITGDQGLNTLQSSPRSTDYVNPLGLSEYLKRISKDEDETVVLIEILPKVQKSKRVVDRSVYGQKHKDLVINLWWKTVTGDDDESLALTPS